MNETIVGTCSCCGGPVCVPMVYWSVVPPVPKCRHCGAVAVQDYGPVIQTRPNPVRAWPSTQSPGDYMLFVTYNSATSAEVKLRDPRVKLSATGEWTLSGNQPISP